MSLVVLKINEKKGLARKIMSKIETGKGLDAKKYCGRIKLKEDPLHFQKRVRDEWK